MTPGVPRCDFDGHLMTGRDSCECGEAQRRAAEDHSPAPDANGDGGPVAEPTSGAYVTSGDQIEKPSVTEREDRRVGAARAAANLTRDPAIALILRDLIAFAEERMRINVGLIAENAALRKQQREHMCGGEDR